MKKLTAVFLALALLLTLTACGAKSANEMAYDMAAPEAAAGDSPMENGITMDAGSSAAGETALPESRKWIITVDMTVETEDLDALMAAIDQQISDLNGYVENQRVTNGSRYSNYRYRSAGLTVRVPAEKVDDFTQSLGQVSNVVRSSKSLEDITLQYVDTETRVKALETERDRLLELMEQAQTMADLLEIEGRLTQVRYELESWASQLRTYDDLVNYATVYLNIEEVTEYTPVEEETLWQRISGGFVSSLKGVGSGALECAVWLLAKSPYIAVFGGIGFGILMLIKTLKKKRPVKKAPKSVAKKEQEQ